MFRLNRAPSGRPPPGVPVGAGAALADRIERFCAAGIACRADDTCAEPGVSGAKHEALGHDAGCRVLGVPRRSIRITLLLWDTAGIAPLLLEAIDEAIEALQDASVPWSEELAGECLAYSIRRRITPKPALC